jgi:hypothetical protein
MVAGKASQVFPMPAPSRNATLKIKSFVIELPKIKPEAAINNMAKLVRSHSGKGTGGAIAKVKIDVNV